MEFHTKTGNALRYSASWPSTQCALNSIREKFDFFTDYLAYSIFGYIGNWCAFITAIFGQCLVSSLNKAGSLQTAMLLCLANIAYVKRFLHHSTLPCTNLNFCRACSTASAKDGCCLIRSRTRSKVYRPGLGRRNCAAAAADTAGEGHISGPGNAQLRRVSLLVHPSPDGRDFLVGTSMNRILR